VRPDRGRGPEVITPQGRNAESPPTATDTASVHGGEVVDLVTWRGRRGACWRCGQPLAGTAPEVLANCAALAREAAR
jgi:hypothetical protein